MQTITVEKGPEPAKLIQQRVPVLDSKGMIEIKPQQKIAYPGGLVIYTRLTEDQLGAVRPTILRAPTTVKKRLTQSNAGRPEKNDSNDVTFGFKPSRPVFGHTAGPVRYTVENPDGYRKLVSLGECMADLTEQHVGEEFTRQMLRARTNIRPEYLMGKTGFTQGVVNRSNALTYHYDRGNFKDSYSAMLWVLQGGLAGGELIIPSLNAFARPTDGGVLIFKGQNLIHGVAPVRKTRPFAERMSVVYYTHEALEKAGSVGDEMRKSKEREFRKHFK